MLTSKFNSGGIAAYVVALLLYVHQPGDLDADWYQSLRGMGGQISCCSHDRDCSPVDDYTPLPGVGFRALIGNTWVDVPSSAVLDRSDNPTGKAVACVGFIDGEPYVRCFVLPAEG